MQRVTKSVLTCLVMSVCFTAVFAKNTPVLCRNPFIDNADAAFDNLDKETEKHSTPKPAAPSQQAPAQKQSENVTRVETTREQSKLAVATSSKTATSKQDTTPSLKIDKTPPDTAAEVRLEGNELVFLKKGVVFKKILTKQTTIQDGEYIISNNVYASTSANHQYAAVLEYSARILPEYNIVSTSTLNYYDASGNILWSKNNIRVGAPPCYALSGNGERVFVTTAAISNDPEQDSYPSFPAIYNKDGSLLWEIGTFDVVNDFKFLENGRYGYFQYDKTTKQGIESGTIFFDVDKKRLLSTSEIGYPDISTTGTAEIVVVRGEIRVSSNGVVCFFDAEGILKFEKQLTDMTESDKQLMTNDEIGQIQNAIKNGEPYSIVRQKTIWSASF